MKFSILNFTIIFILTSQAHAADQWDNEDLTLTTIFTIATIIDWGQTRDISKKQKKGYYEKSNIYLGKYPSTNKVDTYMPLAIITTISIAHFLPKQFREKFLYSVSFLELGITHNNRKIGLKINF